MLDDKSWLASRSENEATFRIFFANSLERLRKMCAYDSGESRDPLNFIIPHNTSRLAAIHWIPAFAGMTVREGIA